MIDKAIIKSNYNVIVKYRFRRRRSVVEFDTGKIQQKKGTQPHCIWQYARGWLMMQRIEDDMEQHLHYQMSKNSTCTEVERKQRKEGQGLKCYVVTLCPFELHKTPNGHHHLNPWIFLPQNHIRYGIIWICKSLLQIKRKIRGLSA